MTDATAAPILIVDFVGEEHRLDPGDQLTFGRAGDIVVDDNRYLHRLLGRFDFRSGVWWLANTGSAVVLRVADRAGTSATTVAPGAVVPLGFHEMVISFTAGGASYELEVEICGLPAQELSAELPDDDAEHTTTAASLPLTDEQRLLLVALAESWLRADGQPGQLPTNRQIASRLGWSRTKYNRKLDGLCQKYARAGVAGLRGDAGALARDRRLRLAEHAVHTGVVTEVDLLLLEPYSPS